MPLGAAALALVTLVTASSRAFALCPNCLGQTSTLTPTLRLVGLFLLVPFVVAFFVARAIRRAATSARPERSTANLPQ